MAQGAVKKAAKPNPGLNRNKAAPKPKKQTGSVVKPQKAKAKTSADRVQKKFTNGMVARTEVLLGERAGHLELIGKGRNKTPGSASETKQKGGTRKFG